MLLLMFRAGDGIRTREYQLGGLMPYHLATPACSISAYSCGSSEILPHLIREMTMLRHTVRIVSPFISGFGTGC